MEGTRQIRLDNPDLIKTRLAANIGSTIQVVLINGTISTGSVLRISTTSLILQNFRQKKMEFRFSEIAEVYMDQIV